MSTDESLRAEGREIDAEDRARRRGFEPPLPLESLEESEKILGEHILAEGCLCRPVVVGNVVRHHIKA